MRRGIFRLAVLGGLYAAALCGVAWTISAAGCGPTCMGTEDYPWGNEAPASGGACGPHPTPLVTGTAGP